ncbi:hypothetical protein BGW39_006106 [Mortierella sp. 14UC]|nr:hypothetical protein BGW39_006106 [Mortierella sp. 14UC]
MSGVPGPSRLAILVQKLTLDPQDEKADPAELDKVRNFYNQQQQEQQQQQQPSGTELSTVVIEKLEILRRYEARFPDLAGAFKKIVQEKLAAEAILKASTPLEDLGDADALEAHLQNMATKNEMSMQEIKRLSDVLRDTLRKKEEESASQVALIETLRTQLMESGRNAKNRSLMDFDLDIDTKVNTSLDLSAGVITSAPATPPPQTDDLPSTTPSTPLTSSTPPSSKSKKSKDPEKKNQALRELMVRLEAVLKEKNQAQEDQEEAVEQVRQLQSRVDEELQVNKIITVELEQLRATVAKMEESRSRLESSTECVKNGSRLESGESIQAARSGTEAALMVTKELEIKLSTVQKEYAILQESMSQSERTLETAKNQIRELGELSKQLRTSKMELDDTQEELQEKQRLLDLERSWREEAEASRDAMKREHDAAVKNSRRVQYDAEEKAKTLESRVDQAVSSAMTESNQKITRLQGTISELKERIVGLDSERAELEHALLERPDRASEISALNNRITQLEQDSQDRQQQIAALTSAMDTSNDDHDPSTEPTIQTLQAKVAQLKEELETTNQTPSLNDLKKLHDELNAGRQAKVDADETIAALQVVIKSAAIASDTVKESDATISLEELSSLKQERAELSEKLARLERLHQGFERSSSERIQTLEQELAVLLKQKAALEAQVQEQSDLLIREKEKEKEMEQARVAEGIDRVTLELAAVRTAERFASGKVTELAKERDLVAEKVVKLEKHLENLKECKVGQEQSLTGRIQELTAEKEAFEKQVEILQLDLEQSKAQIEERENEWTEKETKVSEERDRAVARATELEMDLRNMFEKSNFAQSARQEQDMNKEQLASLTSELRTNSKKLAIAQEQAQIQRTMHADKIAQLSSQLQALKTERDSLSQPKDELESQLAEMTGKAERLGRQVKVMEEDAERLLLAKTEAQEQVSELQGRVSTFGQRECDLKDALALAKETMNHRDEDLSLTQKQLKRAESELEKTLHKLAKVEQAKRVLEEEFGTLKSTLSKNQQEAKAQANHAASQQSTTAKELQRLKATQVKTLQERDQFQKERDQLVQDKDAHQKELERKQAELESLKRMHESAETQIREYQSQLNEARNRVDTLEELTSIAKRVAETKVTELEQLKVKSAEAEQEFTRVRSQLRTKDEEYRVQRDRFRAEVEETRQVLGNKIAELTEQLEKTNLNATGLRELSAQQGEELGVTKSRLGEQESLVKILEQESLDMTVGKRNLELELQHFKDLEEIMTKDRAEHAATIEDYKIREGHLRIVNKTLKEEVRKLQKLSPSSSLPSPTSPHYNSQSNIPSTPTPATPRPRGSGGGPQLLGRAATMAPPVSPRWSPSHAQSSGDDDVNVEYLKNVLLSFMEHKERRQQLIPVVAQMLRLSSDETRRFSKVV